MFLSRRLWSHTLPLVFLIVLWGGAFWRVLFASGADRVVFPQGDFYNHYFNFATYQVERWNQGEFPLWNPYNGAGDPFAANIQLNTFYPPRWFTALIWGRDGWQVEDHMREGALHVLVTSLLMYGFVRHKTRRIYPALFAAVLWAYGGYLMSYPLQQTAVLAAATWLPLMLWGVWWSFQEDGGVWGILAGGGGLALSLLGGHPQTTLYMAYAMVGYGVYVGIRSQPDGAWSLWAGYTPPLQAFGGIVSRLAAMSVLGAALSAMQLLPALEFMRLSGRLNEFTFEQKAQGFVVRDLYQILFPGLNSPMSPLYASLAGGFLALLPLMSRRSENIAARESSSEPDALPETPLERPDTPLEFKSETLIWFVIWLLALVIGLGSQTPLYSLAYALMPGISFFRQPERAALIAQCALVMLAVEGFIILSDRLKPIHEFWRSFVFVCLIVSVGALVVTRSEPSYDAWGLIFLNVLLFALWVIGRSVLSYLQNLLDRAPQFKEAPTYQFIYGPWPKLGLFIALVAIAMLDLMLQMRQSVPYVLDTPENRLTLPQIMAQTQVNDPRDVRWRVDGAFGLRDDAVALRIPNIYHAGPLAIATTEDIRHMPVNRFWEVLSVRYVTLDVNQGFPSEWGLQPLGEGVNSIGQNFILYELPDPRPLAALVYDSRDAGGDRAFARQIMADERVNLREIAVTTFPLETPLTGTRPSVSEVIDLQFQSPEALTVIASTETNALLTLSIPRYPGWQAWLNGAPVEMVEVYGGLIGIPIPAGDNQRIDLKFFSRPVSIGLLMSLGAGLIWLGIALWTMRWR